MSSPSPTARELQAYERSVMDAAIYWTAFVQLAPLDRRRVEVATQDAAIAAGVEGVKAFGKPVLIYAVNAEGRSVCTGYVDRDESFVPAVG